MVRILRQPNEELKLAEIQFMPMEKIGVVSTFLSKFIVHVHPDKIRPIILPGGERRSPWKLDEMTRALDAALAIKRTIASVRSILEDDLGVRFAAPNLPGFDTIPIGQFMQVIPKSREAMAYNVKAHCRWDKLSLFDVGSWRP